MSKKKYLIQTIVITLLLIITFVLCIYLHTRRFPYGYKPARLPVMVSALRSYALDHEGWLPDDGDSFRSLELLWPNYLPDPVDLAGISGNDKEARRRLPEGRHLDSNVSSWVYWPGLVAESDQDIAILWEKESGITFNGFRAEGHAVGFINGSWRQIGSDQWEAFIKEQKRLRETNYEKGRLLKRAASKSVN